MIKTKSIEEVLEKFHHSALHNIAMVINSKQEDPETFRTLHYSTDNAREFIGLVVEILDNTPYDTDSILEITNEFTDEECELLISEITNNLDTYYSPPSYDQVKYED